ncbi:rRNA biogenesis protein RRP36 [Paragonimus heterotremus]|uniref:rRNA biogenesis protein RRP36 n=1 Tax=Paragonimus heterotremus TaxID=100268 RepID=A0A8J4T3E9_9TREM|nr:rRNA biogenesis protein RRP36 [Paragonimus heterotremus]
MSDEPKIITFKELKSKRLKLSSSLQSTYDEGLAFIKAHRNRSKDPRFDPRVNGLCELKDWELLTEEREFTMKKLKKMLKKDLDPETHEKVKRAVHLLKQREATYRDRTFRRKTMKEIHEMQLEQLQSGRRVKFVKRSKLRAELREKRLKSMSRKQREKYLMRQQNKQLYTGTDSKP